MKLGTSYWIAIRHVGEANWHVEPQELPADQMILLIARIIREVTLAKQLVIAIGRSAGEVTQRVMGQRGNRVADDEFEMELNDELAKFLQGMED